MTKRGRIRRGKPFSWGRSQCRFCRGLGTWPRVCLSGTTHSLLSVGPLCGLQLSLVSGLAVRLVRAVWRCQVGRRLCCPKDCERWQSAVGNVCGDLAALRDPVLAAATAAAADPGGECWELRRAELPAACAAFSFARCGWRCVGDRCATDNYESADKLLKAQPYIGPVRLSDAVEWCQVPGCSGAEEVQKLLTHMKDKDVDPQTARCLPRPGPAHRRRGRAVPGLPKRIMFVERLEHVRSRALNHSHCGHCSNSTTPYLIERGLLLKLSQLRFEGLASMQAVSGRALLFP